MPTDGQHVYGAQHPPSIKLIKELRSSATTSSSSSSVSTGQTSSFKDYEKKTFDVWDIDDESIEYNSIMNPNLISITDSEEMAKKVIKNHQENQEKSITSSVTPTKKITNLSNTTPKTMSNGPGKALRQGYTASCNKSPVINGQLSVNSHATNSQSPSISNEQIAPSSSPTKSIGPKIADITTDKNTASNSMAVRSKKGGDQNENQSHQIQHQQYTNYLMNINQTEEIARIEKFRKIIGTNPVNLEELQKACWKGIPKKCRPECWKLLSDYLPLKQESQQKVIEQKRNSYWESVNEHYSSIYIDSHHEMLRQILNDIPRMNPLIPIFQKKIVQDIFQRVLYVWAVRHPASGYVQGINDLLTPFFTVFLTEYTDTNTEIENVDIENMPEKYLRQVEADSYWCMTKLLERIQENYVFSQPGIQRKVQSLEDLIKRIDKNLHGHLKKNHIEFIQFAFRWMNNMLMREIPLSCTIRLWDTYQAEPFGFSDFHLYVCAAFLLRFSKNIIAEKDFQGLMLLLQNLPTRNLKAEDITLLTAEAYKLQVMFANSPNHTA